MRSYDRGLYVLMVFCLSGAIIAQEGDIFRDRVLPPWTPVRVKGNDVHVWNRVYRFEKGPLPVSMSSAEEELLAGPISLAVSADGKSAVLGALVLHLDNAAAAARITGFTATAAVDGLFLGTQNGKTVMVRPNGTKTTVPTGLTPVGVTRAELAAEAAALAPEGPEWWTIGPGDLLAIALPAPRLDWLTLSARPAPETPGQWQIFLWGFDT